MISHLDAEAASAALQALQAAFPERPPARDMELTRPGGWYDEAGQLHVYENPEAREVARFFAGAPWMDVANENLLRFSHANVSMIHLSPRALAYYLPAYLKAFLTVPIDPVIFAVLEAFIRALTAPVVASDESELRERFPGTRSDAQRRALERDRLDAFQEFIQALDDAQRAAVATFLQVIDPLFEDDFLENTVRTALDRFWGRYARAPEREG